jgi:hypothetical protein
MIDERAEMGCYGQPAVRGNVTEFATGHASSWVYPIWMVLAGASLLIMARRAQPSRWTATIIARH